MQITEASSRSNDSSPPKFLFVPSNELRHGQGNRGRPESQRYNTAARKHVMREIGLSRRRPQHRKSSTVRNGLVVTGKHIEEVTGERREGSNHCNVNIINPELQAPIPRLLAGSRLDPFTRWPVKVTKRMQYLLDYFLTTDCSSITPVRIVSWDLVSIDVGFLYHVLAISGFCLSGRYSTNVRAALMSEAVHNYNTGLTSVNRRLDDRQERLSDGVILSILGNAIHTLTPGPLSGWCWEGAQSSWRHSNDDYVDEWAVHMRAIHAILQKRGGIATIESNTTMRHFLYLNDMEGAITRDMQPFFPIPKHIQPLSSRVRMGAKPRLLTALSTWARALPAQIAVIKVFVDMGATVEWLSEQLAAYQPESSWTGVQLDAIHILPLCHHCLSLSQNSGIDRSRGDNDASADEGGRCFTDALRHAIVVFLAPVRRRMGLPAPGTSLHLNNLSAALRMCLVHPATLILGEVIFWMLVAGAMEVCALKQDPSWFFERIVDACTPLGLRGYDSVRQFTVHAVTQSVWFEEALSPNFELMMGELRVFMEANYKE